MISMEIRSSQKFCIITPLSPRLDARETCRLREEINLHPDKHIGIDLNYVEDCTIDFLELAKKMHAGFFNIQSDIFSLFIVMDIDKSTELYTTEEDFITGKRRLLNRRFSVV